MSFGKFGDMNSAFADNFCLLSTTLTGQMYLTMLFEQVFLKTDCIGIHCNTDGAAVLIRRDRVKDLMQICDDFSKFCGIPLEHETYSKFWLANVNNYVALSNDGSIKLKGRYVIDKDFHQKNANRICIIAAVRYFLNGIPVEETINNHLTTEEYPDLLIKGKPIKSYKHFDFFDWVRARGSGKKGRPDIMYIEGNSNIYNSSLLSDKIQLMTDDYNILKRTKLQKINRFYVSKKGGKIVREYKDGSFSNVVAGSWQLKIANKIEPTATFNDIDYRYYITEAKKLITAVEGNGQLSLFA